MWIKQILRIVPLCGFLTLAACGGGGGGGDDTDPPTPVTTTNYTADFSAMHVIDAEAAPASVSASASLQSARGDDITASGTVTVTGTTATSVSINVGYAGENGPVALMLNDTGGGNWAVPSDTVLDIDELRRLDSTGFYIQIVSPDGELRGQILPPGWAVGSISLDAASVVPTSNSGGSATAGIAINPNVGTYYVRVTLSGINDATSAGIRNAIAGTAGELVSPLEESMATPGVWGSRDINDANANDLLTATGIQLLSNGELYISVESMSNPNGALRGQIIDDSIDVFFSEMSAAEVVTGGAPVVSSAVGFATITWVEALSTLGVAVNTDAADIVSVGIFEGLPGENGTLAFTLTQDAVLTGNWVLEPSSLSSEQATTFDNGGFYVSIETAANPGGELRGQLAMPPAGTAVKMIGPGGGQISTPDGVALEIPPGALTTTLPISARRLEGTRSLPAPFADPFVPLNAAAEFGPPGVEFELPVSLSIELEKQATPGATQPLLVHDRETGTWRETEFIATVGEDGLSATADLMHFSDYAVTFSERGSAGYFGSIDLLNESRDEIFERIRNRFQELFIQGAVARPYDPGTVPETDTANPGLDLANCYFPGAATYILDTGNSTLSEIEPALVQTVGNPDGATFIMAFSRFYERSFLTIIDGDEVSARLTAWYQVFIYYFATSPDVAIEADPRAVWVNDQTDITARVLCGETGFEDQDVSLVLNNSSIGSVTPLEGKTDQNGVLDAMFSAGATQGGSSQISASMDWSDPIGGVSLTLGDSTSIRVFSLTGDWSGSGSETISQCEDTEDNGTFEGAADFPISQNGNHISGGGFWTSFSGTVTPQPNGAFSVAGTYEDTESGVTSTGSFNGNGSMADGTLSLSWTGSDSVGTCLYSGSGTATLM